MNYLAVFKALANPYRLKILAALSDKPRTITDLSKLLKISAPLVSIHLRKLKKAGLVKKGERETIERKPDPPLNKLYYEVADFNFQFNPEALKKEVSL
jgi:DNA-binding transcriptional ArsR family regulator